MNTQDASVVIAATSLAFNVIQAIIIYRLGRVNLTRDQAIAVARSLLQELERTQLFTIDAHQEIWEFGFETVRNLASHNAVFQVTVMRSKFVSDDTRRAVTQLQEHVQRIRALHDSWRAFRDGKGGNWLEIQRTWPDIERAEALLKATQPVAEHCKRSLTNFLSSA
ncbi:hypothetical protein WM11_12040 [Burkholderia ubonensis]|uniref:hypothetical protein n=1 Tax=Burkholderia ubonensis TaxID=101571 RepID=UPI0007537DF4|nr:hypothetical protein [Burkholderia ubonensis]KWK06111.1 hypothetical protein WM11_12040 [Burkholderia ubonensis]KWK56606.1 hypothetical protein WM14_27535 [Burkholderia ubonensis]